MYGVMPPLAPPDVSEHPNMTRAGPGTGSKCFTTAANVSQLSSLSQNHSALSVNINQKHTKNDQILRVWYERMQTFLLW